jgi:hypothetical protein
MRMPQQAPPLRWRTGCSAVELVSQAREPKPKAEITGLSREQIKFLKQNAALNEPWTKGIERDQKCVPSQANRSLYSTCIVRYLIA